MDDTSTSSTSSNNTNHQDVCVLCLDQCPTYTSSICNHALYCHKCLFDMWMNNNLLTNCPICRHENITLIGKCTQEFCNGSGNVIVSSSHYPECDACRDFLEMPMELRKLDPKYRNFELLLQYYISHNIETMSPILFGNLFKALKRQPNYSNWITIFNNFLIEHEFFNTKKNFVNMFTKVQIELIATSLERFEKNNSMDDRIDQRIYKVLARLCIAPYSLSIRLVKHGVCYHGNLGEYPGAVQAVNLLITNYIRIKPQVNSLYDFLAICVM